MQFLSLTFSFKLVGACIFFALPQMVAASSADSWAAFRKEVSQACMRVAPPHIKKPTVVVDPFGSESYGLALIRGKTVSGQETQSIICVFDKQTKKVELGSELKIR